MAHPQAAALGAPHGVPQLPDRSCPPALLLSEMSWAEQGGNILVCVVFPEAKLCWDVSRRLGAALCGSTGLDVTCNVCEAGSRQLAGVLCPAWSSASTPMPVHHQVLPSWVGNGCLLGDGELEGALGGPVHELSG